MEWLKNGFHTLTIRRSDSRSTEVTKSTAPCNRCFWFLPMLANQALATVAASTRRIKFAISNDIEVVLRN
jgi:hypothetical protein